MKKVSNSLGLAMIRLIVCVLLLTNNHELLAQNNDNLTGTWHLNINKTIEVMDSPYKVHYDTLPAEIKDKAVNRMNGREFIFSQGGDITVNWKSHNGQQVSTGRWIKDEENKIISIVIENITSSYSYELPSPEVLIMRTMNKKGLFDNLYLQRIN